MLAIKARESALAVCAMLRAQIIPIGDAIGIVLPEAVVKRLGISVDDTLVIVQNAIGFEFWPEEPDPLKWEMPAPDFSAAGTFPPQETV